MSYGGFNSYGGMGGGMGGGGSSSMMMSAAMSASMLSVALVGGYMLMNKNTSDSTADVPDSEPAATSAASSTTAPSGGNLDGARLITLGSLSMKVEGSCGKGSISFAQSQNDKWNWKLRKAGALSDGTSYYVIESDFKNFNHACSKRFLTAPLGCKSAPYLDKAQFGPQQYWLVIGDDNSGYQLQSLACKQGRFERSFLMQAAQAGKKKPIFSARGGSSFQITAPFTG